MPPLSGLVAQLLTLAPDLDRWVVKANVCYATRATFAATASKAFRQREIVV
jgi:hypothetical protein